MAEISKLSGVAIANVAKVDAILKASIANINDLTIPSAAAFLLDTYPATAAYSLRKLKTGVTVAARIRRSGDDIEADVEFDTNDEISLTSPISNASSGTYTDLADFVDHTGTARDAFIDEWKDQSGNSYHAAQATAGSQPKLYDATTGLITENGKPALDFDGSNDYMERQFSQVLGDGLWMEDWAMFCAVAVDASSPVYTMQQGTSAVTRFGQYYQVGSTLLWFRANPSPNVSIVSTSNLVAGHVLLTATSEFTSTSDRDHTAFIDGTQIGTVNDTTTYADNTGTPLYNNLRIGQQFASQYLNGRMQELVLYSSDETSNRSGIETDINAHYQIGNFGTPTSGLLATYTGAAAAYSVRQLANTAALAMRIREDGTDTETDIGFDSNGDLATADIAAFCGSNNGYVVTWYDQAGSQVDATQSTTTAQPQIYNGTAVITENGKPAIEWDGSNDYLASSSAYPTSTNESHFMVRNAQAIDRRVACTRGTGGAGTVQGWHHKTWAGDYAMVDDGSGNSIAVSNTTPQSGQLLRSAFLSQSAISIFDDGSSYGSASGSTGSFNSGRTLHLGTNSNFQNNQFFDGNMQELIFYNSDKSSNRSGIETNINNYFSIY